MKYYLAMKREDIIRDIHGLDAELAALEEQYGLLSADFYHCYRAGELAQSRDFIRWAGFCEAKQEREAQYRQLIYEHLRELRRRAGLGALALEPGGCLGGRSSEFASAALIRVVGGGRDQCAS